MQYPTIDPVALALGPLQVHWYGIMYLLGIGGGWWLLARRCGRGHSPVTRQQLDDLIFYVALGIIFGGRLGYALFYGFDRMLAEPLWALRVWEGGMSFHGGFLGVMLAMWWYARRVGSTLFTLLDFIAPVVPIGLGCGRIGNFIGQELWGRATDAPWGMVFPADPLQLSRHPSQLYQAVLEGLVMFAVLYVFSSRTRPKYAVSGLFALLYGVFRFSVEFVREPDAHIGFDLLGWLTRGQLLSLPMIVVGVVLLVMAYGRGEQATAKGK